MPISCIDCCVKLRLCKEEPENISLRVERHEISRRGKGGGGTGGERKVLCGQVCARSGLQIWT